MAGERERQIGLLEGARTCFEDDACFSPLALGGAPCRAELTEGVRARLIGGILGGGGARIGSQSASDPNTVGEGVPSRDRDTLRDDGCEEEMCLRDDGGGEDMGLRDDGCGDAFDLTAALPLIFNFLVFELFL